MSFLYPRTIAIKRAGHQQDGEGSLDYGGVDEPEGLEKVAQDLRCNIQSRSSGRANPTGLPTDRLAPSWYVNIPKGLVAEDVIRNGDLAYDDLGRRFRVQAAYCHSLGWRLTCDQLEA